MAFLYKKGGFQMTINCFKTVSAKGLIYLPVALRRFVGIHEDDVVQITGRGGIILINKAEVTAENPVEVLQADFQKEKEDAEKERDQIKNRIKQLLSEGKSLDEVLDEVLRFLF
jgi:bifunctional DNA-binding transcriptional regulator/antitoxin component of YhaV-PrlF toxin-antitoxin module